METLKRLTFQEMEQLYPNEWIWLEAPETHPNDITKADGIVVVHHPDKRILHELAREVLAGQSPEEADKPATYKMIYAGKLNITHRPWLRYTIIPESRKTI